MKILIINHFPLEGSGSGVYAQNIAISLMKKGHDVTVIMPANTTNYLKIDGIKMHPVFFKKEEVIEGQLDFNFPCFTTHPESIQSFYDLNDSQINEYVSAFKRAIDEEIKENKPDVIHAQHIWILASLAVDTGIKTVITAHGTDIIGHKKDDRFHKYTKNAVSKSKKIITISKDNKKLVKDIFGVDSKKIELMPNGYNPSKFYIDDVDKKTVLSKYGIEKDYKHIVSFAGKLTQIKGIDVLLRANKIYDNDDTLTLLAGNGELYEELNNLKDELGLKNTYFIGNQNHDDLRCIYNIADVSIVPSRVEGFGLVAIEALACGTPVITSDQGGLPEIVNDQVGMIFKSEDYHELASHIKEILNKEYDKKSINKYVLSKYSQDSLINKLIKLYE